MKNQTNTKERIEEIALELFAKYGYTAVSIRDICKKLGYTESSIYYHFKNKQAIMEALLLKVDVLIEEKTQYFDEIFAKTEEVTEEAMGLVAAGLLVTYLLHPYVFKIISILTLERMSNPEAYQNYERIVFKLPLEQQEKVFRQMIDRGFIKNGEPALLAEQYYALIYLPFQRSCIGVELNDQIIAATAEEVNRNIKDFFQKIKREEK